MPLKIVTDYSREDGRSRFVEWTPPRDRGAGRPDPVRPPGRPRHGLAVETPTRELFVGLDLGQAADFTALAVVERTPTGYAVPYLSRTRGKAYTEVVARVADLMRRAPLAGSSRLAGVATGVGRPGMDRLRSARVEPRRVAM